VKTNDNNDDADDDDDDDDEGMNYFAAKKILKRNFLFTESCC